MIQPMVVFPAEVNTEGNMLIVDGHGYSSSLRNAIPKSLPWKELNVDLVFECTGLLY